MLSSAAKLDRRRASAHRRGVTSPRADRGERRPRDERRAARLRPGDDANAAFSLRTRGRSPRPRAGALYAPDRVERRLGSRKTPLAPSSSVTMPMTAPKAAFGSVRLHALERLVKGAGGARVREPIEDLAPHTVSSPRRKPTTVTARKGVKAGRSRKLRRRRRRAEAVAGIV